MGTIRCEITINKPVGTVYEYFANPDRAIARATPDIESVERLSPGPTAPGSWFSVIVSPAPGVPRNTIFAPTRNFSTSPNAFV